MNLKYLNTVFSSLKKVKKWKLIGVALGFKSVCMHFYAQKTKGNVQDLFTHCVDLDEIDKLVDEVKEVENKF